MNDINCHHRLNYPEKLPFTLKEKNGPSKKDKYKLKEFMITKPAVRRYLKEFYMFREKKMNVFKMPQERQNCVQTLNKH